MRPRGFTLLELIIVIAIIGVLSTLILPTFSTAIEKARVAKILAFATSFDRSLEIVGSWRFEEGSGTTVKDEGSGNGGLAAITNGAWSTDTYGTTQAYSISYNGTSTVVTPSTRTVYEIGTGSKAWSVWFKTGTGGVMFRRSGPGNIGGFIITTISAGRVQCYLTNPAGTIIVDVISAKSYTDNKWHYAICSLDRPNSLLKIYIDGELAGSSDASLLSGVDMICGSSVLLGHSSYTGLLDDFRIYNSSVTLSQAKQMYWDGISSGKFADR